MRAVVVLLLLIANAIVASWKDNPPDPAPVDRGEYTTRLLANIDGASVSEQSPSADGGCVRVQLERFQL